MRTSRTTTSQNISRTEKRKKSPHDPVTAYAQAVVDRRIVAGPHVRDACARHLSDLRAGVWNWNLAAALRAIGFYPDVLRLNGGEHEGAPFVLLDWEQFIAGCLFGWQGKDGYRRFRVAYIETAKGSGKSPLVAGIGLYMMVADGEARAEVYAAATKKDQAAILFRDAVAMVRQSPRLDSMITFSGGRGREWNMAALSSASFFRPISSDDGQSGPRPHCALMDEIHEHRSSTMVEMMRAGTKGRRQALLVMITNSGSDRTGVCWQYHEYAAKVAAGTLTDDAFFSYVCALDETDDPLTDEAAWIKANPSLPVVPGIKYLREQVTQACGMPAKEAIVRRLNFCQWTDAQTPWIDRDLWEACEKEFDVDELRGLPCALGLDLSSKRDLTALAAVWRHPDQSLSLAAWFWTPGETLSERARLDNVDYRLWRDTGHLFAPPGRIIEKEHVARFVQEFAAAHDVRLLAYDQAQSEDFLRACDEIGLDAWIDDGGRPKPGLRMVRHGQGFSGFANPRNLWMPRSINDFEAAIVRRNIRIKINPVLRWNGASAVLLSDPSGNRKWDKRKATGRIDGIVASSMSVGAACDTRFEPPTYSAPVVIAL